MYTCKTCKKAVPTGATSVRVGIWTFNTNYRCLQCSYSDLLEMHQLAMKDLVVIEKKALENPILFQTSAQIEKKSTVSSVS